MEQEPLRGSQADIQGILPGNKLNATVVEEKQNV
jgi:hypothetical protein